MMIKRRNIKLNLGGQSLFEVVLALGIISFIMVALISLTTLSVRNASVTRNKTSANRFAQEAVEWLRGERDADYDLFKGNVPITVSSDCPTIDISGYTQTYPCMCLIDANSTVWNDKHCIRDDPASLVDGKYAREISFRIDDVNKPNQVDAAIIVSWTDSEGDHAVRLDSILGDWRAQP